MKNMGMKRTIIINIFEMKGIVEIVEKISEDVMYRERHLSIMDAVKDVGFRCVNEVLRWIPIEEELPPKTQSGFSDLVLTKNAHNVIKVERYDFESKQFNEPRYGDEVIAWRRIDFD